VSVDEFFGKPQFLRENEGDLVNGHCFYGVVQKKWKSFPRGLLLDLDHAAVVKVRMKPGIAESVRAGWYTSP